MLEFLPDDGGRKNRKLLWKKFTGADPNQWYGPTPRPTWVHWFKPTEPGAGDSGFEKWMESPSPIPHPSWYDPTVAEKASEVATTDTLGHGQTAEKAHKGLMYVTPKQYQDDVNAILFYGSLGLYDPTNAADIPYWRNKGWSTKSAIGFMLLRATLPAALIGWWIDPADKRKGGLAEDDWYDLVTDPSYWFGPGAWWHGG